MSSVGWREALPGILTAGNAVRGSSVFDEKARKLDVDTEILKARQFPLWIPVVAFAALLIPNGWFVTIPLLIGWGVLIAQAHKRGVATELRLAQETKDLRAKMLRENEQHGALLSAASHGDVGSLNTLLEKWSNSRPSIITAFEVGLSKSLSGRIDISGRAVGRSEIVQLVPRLGRGRKTYYDKRKASEIDEDLSEINACALLSLLNALFASPTPQSVHVRIELGMGNSTEAIPWIVLFAQIDRGSLEALSPVVSAVDAIRKLGGDVGRCRAQRYTSAREPTIHAPTPPLAGSQPDSPSERNLTNRLRTANERDESPQHASYESGAVPLEFSALPISSSSKNTRIPPPPDQASRSSTIATPLLANVRGQFARVARKFADYSGVAGVPEVPFQAYWATYANMNAEQLEFYFSWRGAVRSGNTPRTYLSYIFVHVCELLHLIGAVDAADATRQLQTLWMAYRTEFPKLDLYLIPWIADLYAIEIDPVSAISFMSVAAGMGADLGKEELLLVTDTYWSQSDYSLMPSTCVSKLIGDSRQRSNKFYTGYNGDGWVDQAYRESLIVTDRAYLDANGKTVRDAAVLRDGLQVVSREAFRGAVYDWKKKQVKFGKTATLDETSLAVQLYRNAAKYGENILRKEKNFPSKLRGITLPNEIESALGARFGEFVRTTRPRARVNIDFAKAAELSKASEDVRSRLLAGLDEAGDPISAVASAGPAKSPNLQSGDLSRLEATGLLTDLDAVTALFEALSEAARTLLRSIEKGGWEVDLFSKALEADCNGVLLQPLIAEINACSQRTLQQDLLVREDTLIVLQEDLRDEVYWVIEGSLNGFERTVGQRVSIFANQKDAAHEADELHGNGDFGIGNTDGFDAAELRALCVLHCGENVIGDLSELAMSIGQSPLLLLDRINELALSCPFGDLIVDCDANIPAILPDASQYVEELLSRTEGAINVNQVQS
jgi:TerB-like protein